MSVQNVKDSIFDQIKEICSNSDDERLLQDIQQMLSLVVTDSKEIRQQFSESVVKTLEEHEPGFLLRLFGAVKYRDSLLRQINSEINMLDVSEKTTTENPEEFKRLIKEIKDHFSQLQRAIDIKEADNERCRTEIRKLERQMGDLAAGYQRLLCIIHKKEGSASDMESIIIESLSDIGARVIWDKPEDDIGEQFNVISVPETESTNLINKPCIAIDKSVICKGTYYKIIKGDQ